jgi:superfamily II DNA or RNA helicase
MLDDRSLPAHHKLDAIATKLRRLAESVDDSGAAGSDAISPKLIRRRVKGAEDELFDYQSEIVDKVRYLMEGDLRRALVSLPTGGGKTRTASVICREAIHSGAREVWWVAPGRELIFQALEAITRAWRASGVGSLDIVGDPLDLDQSRGPSMVLVTAQWLGQNRDHHLVREASPDLVIFDEAHHALASTYLEGLNSLCDTPVVGDRAAFLLGLSATPGRADREEQDLLPDVFDRQLVISEVLGGDPVGALQDRGVLAEVVYRTLGDRPTIFPSMPEIIADDDRLWATAEALCAGGDPGRTVVFAGSVDHAFRLNAAIVLKGTRAVTVTARTPVADRDRYLQWFGTGRTPILVNKEIFVAGFDLPSIESVCLAAPVRSAVKYEQVIGRALRGPAVGGQPTATVIQWEDHRHLHGKLQSSQRYIDGYWRVI